MLSMGGPPDPREARSEGKLHDPPIQDNKSYLWPWMARIRWRYAPEAGHGEIREEVQAAAAVSASGRLTGRATNTEQPLPNSLSSQARPPCSSASPLTSARPSPVPPA